MKTAYLPSHKASVVILESETLLGITNHYVMCEDGPFAGRMVYVSETELRMKGAK